MLTGQLLIGTAMIGTSVFLHVGGLIAIIAWLRSKKSIIDNNHPYIGASRVFLASVWGVFLLHAIGILGWGILYVMLDQMETLERSLYFSIVTYTTLGYGDIVLEPRWQFLSGLEAINGVVLIGVSTAFLFAILTHVFQRLGILKSG